MEQITISDIITISCACIMAILGVIEKSQKIKWKPFNVFRDKELHKKVDKLETNQKSIVKTQKNNIEKLYEVENTVFQNEKDRLRSYMLMFANEVRQKMPKSKYQYEEFFRAHDKYEKIIDTLGVENSFVDNEVEFVKSIMNKQ